MAQLQIVTGGTSGMGLATAAELGKYGPVLVGGRSQKRIDSTLETLACAGVTAYGHPCDISDVDSLTEFAEYATTLGDVGNVVNAAGVDYDAATTEQLVDINMRGTVNVVETFLPLMKDATMVNYSSITGYFYQPFDEERAIWDDATAPDFVQNCVDQVVKHPNPQAGMLPDTYVAYCASKQFVMYYTKANATRFGARGLRILSVAPGSFLTPMLEGQSAALDAIAQGTVFKRLGDPAEIGKMVAAVVDPGMQYLTGCDIVMDGGKLAMITAKQIA